MVDPVAFGIALAIIAVFIMVLFYFFSNKEEGDFEKAFDENALRLLTEQQKEKSKTKKSSKKKKDSKVDVGGSKELTESTEIGDLESEQNIPISETQPKSECTDFAQVPESVDQASPNVLMAKKKNRKSKNKRDEEDFVAEPVDKRDEQTIHEVPRAESRGFSKEKSPKRIIIDVNELDANKVLTRFAGVDDVEPEYISFLATFFHDTGYKMSQLQGDVAAANATASEKQRRIEQLTLAKNNADRQVQDQQRVLTEMNERLQKANMAGEAARSRLATLDQIRSENEELKNVLVKTTESRTESVKTVERLQKEFDMATSKIRSLEHELAVKAKAHDAIVKEAKQSSAPQKDQRLELDQLQAQMDEFEMATRQVQQELRDKNAQLASLYAISADRDKLEAEFARARSDWKTKEAKLMEEYHSLQNLVSELHKEVEKFEIYKKEQDEVRKQLIAKERELEEKRQKLSHAELLINGSAAHATRIAELEKENDELRAHVDSLKAQLADVSGHLQERTTASSVGVVDVQEEALLKKSRPLDAPQDANEFLELQSRNADLQRKNEELRERNFKILANVAEREKELARTSAAPAAKSIPVEAPKSSYEERALIIEAIGPMVDEECDVTADAEEFSTWLKDASRVLKQRIEHRTGDLKMSGAAEELQVCRSALSQLAGELARIERLANARRADYDEKISKLQENVDKADRTLVEFRRLKVELKECTELREQIDELRGLLSNAEKGRSPVATSSKSAARSDESDWELVSN